jgi:hypothetical protein
MLTRPLGFHISKLVNELHPLLCHVVREHGDDFFNYVVILRNDCNQ